MKLVSKKITPFLILALIIITSGVFDLLPSFLSEQIPEPIKEAIKPKEARAVYQYTPTGGQLVVGAEVTASLTNISTWRGLSGNDGRYWSVTRTTSPAGMDRQIFFDGVNQYGANKMLITLESANVTTADAFRYQICDWVSSTLVDAAASGNCTTGGWRTLNMRKVDLTQTTDTTTSIEIYDGYFWDRTTSPGTVVSTPIANFIKTDATKRVLIRVFSTVSSVVQHNMDEARIELAIDPVYEPSSFTKITPFAGATTAFVSDMIGVGASDGNKLSITNTATNPLNVYFSFTNVKTYTGANTIVVKPEICVLATTLTFNVWIYNFTTAAWEQLNTALVTGSACTTDTPYAYAKNNVTLTNYISSGEVRVRFNTAVLDTNTFQLDRLYLMVGSTNADSSLCEISMGTGTATNCANTRTVADVETGSTANTTTWQITSALEYPSTRWALDDDNATDAEAGQAANLSFPVTISSGMAVTGLHWATRWRSNVTTETIALNARDYGAVANTTGGWSATLGTTNALTTYTWTDSWQSAELQANPEDYIDTVNNLARLRRRTSVSTDTTAGDIGDWDFAMVSIRWVEEPARVTLISQYTPTGGQLVVGAEVTASLTNISTWRGLSGNDGRYWSVTRTTSPAGMDRQIFFDGVNQYGANKMLITLESANVTTADAFRYQICDWVSSTLVDAAASGNCTTGGWRTLNMRKVDLTQTTDTTTSIEIYDGYFWDRTTSPGTVVSTPIANFIKTDATKRVLIRVFSTVSSVVQHNMDEARIELAIDPVYEPSSFTKITPFAGATTAFVSDMIGVGASDGNKLSITNTATNPLNVYFSFTNVKTYTGANTIVVKPEICVLATTLTFNVWIYNFTTAAWEQLNTALVTGSACTTDTPYAYAKNNVTLTNYISSGEVRVRFNTAVLDTNTFQLDRLYLMVGSTNADSSLCEISMGTGTATNCANTRTVADVETGSTANTTTWQITSALEYPSTRWALDDDNATDAEAGQAANLSFPVTISSGMAVTGLHWATRWRSNVTTETIALNARDYGAVANTTGGWSATLGTTNALTTYTWTDSWQSAELQANPEDYIDTVNNLARLRRRTSVSTDTTAGDIGDWDFAMVSVRWVEAAVAGVITVGATGTQTASMNIPSTNNYVGGAFTFVRNTGSANVTQIIVTDTGTVNANSNLSNLRLRYETAASCVYNGTETIFGTAATFSASEKATVTGTMAVDVSQICVYAEVDVGSGASGGQTLEIEISNPSTEVTVSAGTVTPATAVAIAGGTTLSAAQTLTFSLDANSVNFGTLSTGAVSIGSHTFIVGTNATSGVAVTFSGATLTSGANTITAMATAAPSSVGTEQFGINAKDNVTPNVGAECSGTPPIAAAATGYNTVDNFKFVSGETIVSSNGSINNTTCTISYIANISASTEAGSYTTTLTYIATGTF